MKKGRPYNRWLTQFIFYNIIFLGLQFGFIYSESGSFIHSIPLPAQVYLELIITLFTHLSLYFLLSLVQTSLIWGLKQLGLSLISLERWHITVWSLSVCALLSSNGYFFPLSRFSRLFSPQLPHVLLVLLMLISLLMLSALLLNTVFFACKQYPLVTGGFILIVLNIFLYNNKVPLIERHHPTETTHSNIILIGVDSLGPKSISTKNTPALTHFIKDSVLFKETISPLARTYPAWSSILTGLYPHHHHARYNLMPPELVQSSSSVAWPLQHLGYQTIFATDDRQFNNMGKEFGFQTIIGSKLGVNDMLLGTFNDFPLSNFLVNLPFSHWIFPYNYINRASHFTYSPQSFDKALQYTLASRKQASPLFLAVHFTLPHWPYAWAESPPPKSHEYSPKERAELYLAALNRVDQQVAKLLRELHQYGYLENSLVVLLSDHGEAFYVSGSRQTNQRSYQGPGVSKFSNYLKQKTSTTLERSVGHGSDLLSAAQYHCILAFKIYRQNQLITTPKVINTRVALLDIAPTIYAFLNKPARQQVDGISLLKPLISDENLLHERFFIMESGMLPNQFLSREKAKVLGKKYFTVDAQTSQLQLRKKELAALDAMKLYAVIEGNWILALYPDGDDYMPIIMNLYSGKWTDELTSDFARLSPATNLLNHLQLFYKKKWPLIGDVPLKG